MDVERQLPDPKVEQAVFGQEVENFLTQDRIGVYLVARAREEAEAGMIELKDADPAQPEQIRTIQNRIRVAESVITWLGQAISEGLQARQILEDEGT